MPGDWCVETFENAPLQIIDGDRGTNYPNQTEFSAAGHCLFLNAGNVTTTGFRFSDCAFITAEKDALLRKGKLVRNDVVLTTRGTVGNAAYFDDSVPFDNIRINSGMVILRAQTPALHPRYLYLFVRSALFHAQVSALRTGSAQPQLPIQDINRIEIPIPPSDEQHAIAHILGTLDDKIELNRRMNETLVAMTRALFKSWFVDFDPVRAKVAGRDPGLPKSLADLFPDSFEDSELGEIPKGWRVCFIRDLTSNIQYGFTQSASSDLVGPRFLRITDIQGGKVDWSTVPYCEVTPEEHERYSLKPGDVLVARTGASTGENIYLSYAPDAVFASYLVRFQFPDLANARLVVAFMRTQAYFEYVAGGIGGSAQPNASAQVLAGAQLVVPTPSIARMFSDLVVPLDLSIVANAHESRTLTALRDTLLPKLISGELRIEDAKRVIHDPPGQAAGE